MGKNHMPEVAKILGVELGEEFELNGSNAIYKLSQYGFFFKCGGTWMRASDYLLTDVIKGVHTIKKLPWKPKRGDTYCYVYWKLNLHTKKWEIDVSIATYDDNCPPHNLCVDVGNCFRTRKEAEAAKYEVYKRLTGKDWSEVHG